MNNPSDSIYYYKLGEKLYLIRLYSDGTVYGTSTNSGNEGIPVILKSFNRENYISSYGVGVYKINGYKISFQLTSKLTTLIFDGMFMPNGAIQFKITNSNNKSETTRIYSKYNDIKTKVKHELAPIQNTIVENDSTPISNYSNTEDKGTLTQKFTSLLIISAIVLFLFTCGSRKRTGATCWDGSGSGATGSGACSHHGGVMYWEHKYWWE